MCVYGCVSIANFVKYLKKRVIGTIGATYDYAHWFFYLLLQHGVTALFFPFHTLLLSLVCICLFVCPSACLCVCTRASGCLSLCLSVCLSVCLIVCLSMCLSVYVSLCLYVCLCKRLSVCHYVLCIYVCCLYCHKCL